MRISIPSLAICLLAACVSLGSIGAANACGPRGPGDLGLVNRAIDAKDTSKVNKAKLKKLRATMLANMGTSEKQIGLYKTASRTALDLIGETTVVPHDAAQAAAARAAIPKGTIVPMC